MKNVRLHWFAFVVALLLSSPCARAQHSRLAFLKPHPVRVFHFVTHHKAFLISSTAFVAADVAYTRSYMGMQNRCSQCLFYGQTHPAGFVHIDGLPLLGVGLFVAANYYLTTNLPEHRTQNQIAMWAVMANGAFWLGLKAYDYSGVDNLNDFNRQSITVKPVVAFAPRSIR